MLDCLSNVWDYLKLHDASNWFVIVFSLLVWPAALYWWSNRRTQSIPNLLVTFTPMNLNIGPQQGDAVLLSFINRTGSIVYLTGAGLTEVRKRFLVPVAASRDMASGRRELVFAIPPDPAFTLHECTLQTGERATAAIAINNPMDEAFYSYRPALLRRCLSLPKYFLLEYVAVVGEKKFSVATVY
jgi:hypothetical protein